MTGETAMHAGVMYVANGEVLLMKRRPDDHMGGYWAFPAGKVESQETAAECAMREFSEETGGHISHIYPAGITGDFELFYAAGEKFDVRLNDEHTDYMWASKVNLPSPLHPGVAESIAAHLIKEDAAMDSARAIDQNGYVTVKRNPITKSGVFPYLGRSLPGAEDPNGIYYVYRPAEEVGAPEAIESFKGLPIIDEHVMLGDGYSVDPEEKGVHGVTGDSVSYEGDTVYSDLRIFTRTLKSLIDAGKRGLSVGYRCIFEKSSGVFDGIPYHYIQRQIRGNHLALVQEGRMGTAVLDHQCAFDHFDLALEQGESTMTKEAGTAQDENEMTLAECAAAIKGIMPIMEQFQNFMNKTSAATVLDEKDEDDDKKDKAEDSDDDDDKKEKAEDEKDDDDKKEKEAMDAKEISALRERVATLETRTPKAVMADIAARDKLANEVAAVVGTFDHAEMSADEVAAYAVKKLEIDAPAGQERAALAGYMAASRKKSTDVFALDAAPVKQGSLLAARLAKN